MSKMMETLDKVDAKYCAGLMSRFEHMGISKSAGEAAIGSMIVHDAIPTSNICVATPSMFPAPSPTLTSFQAMSPVADA